MVVPNSPSVSHNLKVVVDRVLDLVWAALADLDGQAASLGGVVRTASRVARLMGDYSNLWWLELELLDFADREALDRIDLEMHQYFSEEVWEQTRRRINLAYCSERGYQGMDPQGRIQKEAVICPKPVSEIGNTISQWERDLAMQAPPPGLHFQDLYFANERYHKIYPILRHQISEFRAILSRITQRIHTYLTGVEARLLFGQANNDIFDSFRAYADGRLQAIAPDVLNQLSTAFRRAEEGDSEARSQALLMCRRVLLSLADHVYPPSDTPAVGKDGKERKLTTHMYKNRLWQFVTDNLERDTVKGAILAQITDVGNRLDHIYELSNKGVHFDVSEFEMQICIIQTYLVASEVLYLYDQ